MRLKISEKRLHRTCFGTDEGTSPCPETGHLIKLPRVVVFDVACDAAIDLAYEA